MLSKHINQGYHKELQADDAIHADYMAHLQLYIWYS